MGGGGRREEEDVLKCNHLFCNISTTFFVM